MAKHSDLKKLPIRKKNLPKIYSKKKKLDKLPIFNTILLIGIYALLLKDQIISILK